MGMVSIMQQMVTRQQNSIMCTAQNSDIEPIIAPTN